ncbi:MAG: hypothetical protein SGI92_11985 [Bryobacteraceae bacterium]|nr:hypothetical protein [Bryobacteraceae bacterium]
MFIFPLTEESTEWIASTPPECEYFIEMMGSDTTEQRIDITRDEYIALRAHLVKLRGIDQPTETTE